MEKFDLFADLLKRSLIKNGDIPITIRHLLHMIELVNREEEKTETIPIDNPKDY